MILTWKHPRKPYNQDLHPVSFLDCSLDGEWNVFSNRLMTINKIQIMLLLM